jgi:hypothetical protein
MGAALVCHPALAGEEADAPEPAEEEMEQAQMHFELGLEAYQDEKYAQALVHFLDSYDLYPLSEILYNIGYCYEQIGQDAKAIEYYETYLSHLPEDEEKERAKVMARIEVVKGIEDEGKGKKKKSFKKRVTSQYRGDWKHGLNVTVAFDMDPQDPAYPHGSFTSGLGVRGGYSARLLHEVLALGAELGFLSIGTIDLHYHNFILDVNVSGRVGNWVGGTLQLYIGGVVDLKWYFTRQSIVAGADDRRREFFSIGFGPMVRLYWHWSEKVGLLTEVDGVLGLVPTRSMPLQGYIVFRLGLFFGLA